MVLRSLGCRIITLAAASTVAAGAFVATGAAQGFSAPPPDAVLSTGSVSAGGNLVWGGPVPRAPIDGVSSVYVPSVSSPGAAPLPPGSTAYRGTGLSTPVVGPSSDIVSLPLPPMPGAATNQTYPVQDLSREASLPPVGPAATMDDAAPAGAHGSVPEHRFDPWEGLTEGETSPEPAMTPAPALRAAPQAVVPSYAALERTAPPKAEERGGWGWNPFRWGRGALESKTPSGYRAMPRQEATCRRELQKLGVQFTDVSPVGGAGSCGIQNPVRVTVAAKGIAMQPAATLSCQTALATARWLDDDVRSAARWRLWKQPTSVLNASSYRCSRIAGSRTISEHALGNALDVRGFGFADGSNVLVEPKGFWERGERKFQDQIRQASCRHFGTVLGPGYNKAHDDHLHLDVKARMRPVCK